MVESTDELVEKFKEVQRKGYRTETCPDCGWDGVKAEPDATETCCEECGNKFEVSPLI